MLVALVLNGFIKELMQFPSYSFRHLPFLRMGRKIVSESHLAC
jgi:hypothetical protein